jgi:creatinine amidohydrolase/Fe(II)-dependent formamide hydrolase-like protein
MPVLWIGNSVNHLGYRAALFIDLTRYVTVLVDIGKSFLSRASATLFLNGHGRISPLLTALHQLELEYVTRRDDVQIAGTSWGARAGGDRRGARLPDDAAGHACEIETSLMLSSRPELVHQNSRSRGQDTTRIPNGAAHDLA